MPPPKKPTRPNLTLVRNPPDAANTSSATRRELDAFKPLELYPCGKWNPKESGWLDPGEPTPEWLLPIVAQGPRPVFEMESVRPRLRPGDIDSDMVFAALELVHRGKTSAARTKLEDALAVDHRCLDAHAHLGMLDFDRKPKQAREHYERGLAIGDASVGRDFDGVLFWGLHGNRPYLRCLHGVALCAWRLRDFRAALIAFERLLWLNPDDNQGARFGLAEAREGRKWTRDHG